MRVATGGGIDAGRCAGIHGSTYGKTRNGSHIVEEKWRKFRQRWARRRGNPDDHEAHANVPEGRNAAWITTARYPENDEKEHSHSFTIFHCTLLKKTCKFRGIFIDLFCFLTKGTVMDISTLGLADLKTLLREIPREIKRREAAERVKVRRELEELAHARGFSLSDILPEIPVRRVGKRGGAVEIRYRHPQNSAETWSGRGRKPRWVEDWLAGGGTLAGIKV
ncbi:MAG: H-NS histone family protein [Zoogloeaceae bacterium]|jgi:DNA-binding protein H-NS|nr:H-NS histone family protein [Zoogloeaceae bacterium]